MSDNEGIFGEHFCSCIHVYEEEKLKQIFVFTSVSEKFFFLKCFYFSFCDIEYCLLEGKKMVSFRWFNVRMKMSSPWMYSRNVMATTWFFKLKWQKFELGINITTTKILAKFHKDWAEIISRCVFDFSISAFSS